jgi:hypothetical protein
MCTTYRVQLPTNWNISNLLEAVNAVQYERIELLPQYSGELAHRTELNVWFIARPWLGQWPRHWANDHRYDIGHNYGWNGEHHPQRDHYRNVGADWNRPKCPQQRIG